jgi:hypothetical protein
VWLEKLAPHALIDQAGPQADCTTAPAREPGLNEGTGYRPVSEAERNSQSCASWAATRSGGGCDQRPPRLWHVGTDLLRRVCGDRRERRKRVLVKIVGEVRAVRPKLCQSA